MATAKAKISNNTNTPVGDGLARDAGTSFYLDDRSAAIAGKPAPTRDGCCLIFLLLLLPLDCPDDANAPHGRPSAGAVMWPHNTAGASATASLGESAARAKPVDSRDSSNGYVLGGFNRCTEYISGICV